MLNPNNERSLYTSAFIPPDGMEFDEAIATTYSLDLTVLMEVPVFLSHLAIDGQTNLDPISILRATKNYSQRISVFVQKGRILFPYSIRSTPVFGLLESMVYEVANDSDGVFHPKIWIIRFKSKENGNPSYRLVVLSRNITKDRSWDVSLQLEGKPKVEKNQDNFPLSKFVNQLPKLCPVKLSPTRKAKISKFARELEDVKWKYPGQFKSLKFYIPGIPEFAWSRPKSKNMVVISPFCKIEALKLLRKSTENPITLISQPESIAELDETKVENLFENRYVLNSILEENESSGESKAEIRDSKGLHAKIYVFETEKRSREYTHLVIGSANATNAAIKNCKNIEILAELIGEKEKVGGICELLGKDGIGDIIEEYTEIELNENAEISKAEKAIEKARMDIVKAKLSLECIKTSVKNKWLLKLKGDFPTLQDMKSLKVRPITIAEKKLVSNPTKMENSEITFDNLSISNLTSFIAFELISKIPEVSTRFVLNLPIKGLPKERVSAIISEIIKEPEDFANYIYQFFVENLPSQIYNVRKKSSSNGVNSTGKNPNKITLLEELVKLYCRSPEKLDEISKFIRDISKDADKNFPYRRIS